MHMINLKCPNCGAQINADEDRDNIYCTYCGSLVYSKVDSKIIEEHVTRDEARLRQLELEHEKYLKEAEEAKKLRNIKIALGAIGAVFLFFAYLLMGKISDNTDMALTMIGMISIAGAVYLGRNKKS